MVNQTENSGTTTATITSADTSVGFWAGTSPLTISTSSRRSRSYPTDGLSAITRNTVSFSSRTRKTSYHPDGPSTATDRRAAPAHGVLTGNRCSSTPIPPALRSLSHGYTPSAHKSCWGPTKHQTAAPSSNGFKQLTQPSTPPHPTPRSKATNITRYRIKVAPEHSDSRHHRSPHPQAGRW